MDIKQCESIEKNTWEKLMMKLLQKFAKVDLLWLISQDNDNGVYFEAGFAQGLGLKVIWTCHEDHVKDLHFDTRQENHITWENPEDLREKLKNRIRAVIGFGPHKGK